jgi:hypothetical protein
MPILVGKNPDMTIEGLILPILVAPSGVFIKNLREQGKEIPQPVHLMALIDTGATRSMIQDGKCKSLNLIPHNKVKSLTAGLPYEANEYDVSMYFPLLKITFDPIFVLEMPLSGQNISCLIGRDLLSKGLLVYNGLDSSYTLGF